MKNYFFNPGKFPVVPQRRDDQSDSFLFEQGPTKGLGKIQFHDFREAYNSISVPNVRTFKKQIKGLRRLLILAQPSKEQTEDFDFLLILGELFTLVAYGQLIIESAKNNGIEDDLVDQIFDFIVRDFSKFALQLYLKTSSTLLQRLLSQWMIQKPEPDKNRFENIWKNHVSKMQDTYSMKD